MSEDAEAVGANLLAILYSFHSSLNAAFSNGFRLQFRYGQSSLSLMKRTPSLNAQIGVEQARGASCASAVGAKMSLADRTSRGSSPTAAQARSHGCARCCCAASAARRAHRPPGLGAGRNSGRKGGGEPLSVPATGATCCAGRVAWNRAASGEASPIPAYKWPPRWTACVDRSFP